MSFSRKSFFNIVPLYFYVKLWTPSRGPVFYRGSWLLFFIIYTFWGCLLSNIRNWSLVYPEKKMFKHFFYIYFYIKLWTRLGSPVFVQGSLFQKYWIIVIQGFMHFNLTNCSIAVLENKIYFEIIKMFTMDIYLCGFVCNPESDGKIHYIPPHFI